MQTFSELSWTDRFVCLQVRWKCYYFMSRQPLLFLGLFIGASRSVGLPWTSDLLVAETSTWQHSTLTRDIRASGGIRTYNSSKQAAADPRFRPRGHWDRSKVYPYFVQPFDITEWLKNSTRRIRPELILLYLCTEVHISCANWQDLSRTLIGIKPLQSSCNCMVLQNVFSCYSSLMTWLLGRCSIVHIAEAIMSFIVLLLRKHFMHKAITSRPDGTW
jgi:hypothetical protein